MEVNKHMYIYFILRKEKINIRKGFVIRQMQFDDVSIYLIFKINNYVI